ncbi:hypothetical protein TGAM01_v200248 [Trichoderma gamsii]|uniref:Uncharacterized protein n=1 Tax=Trichoderma gamsii TaxID=398673 RepID=A0A2P5A2Q4_9HYPO|nr:hypothetical protein TGAM01_v200248 [Trichoderma gamsii]PON30828.1 hypothetical protein TGAM01_v200248 [Trichoderma gamsii]
MLCRMPPLFFLPMGIKDNGLAGCGNPRSGTLIPNSHKVGLPITIVPSSACLGLEWGFSRSVHKITNRSSVSEMTSLSAAPLRFYFSLALPTCVIHAALTTAASF